MLHMLTLILGAQSSLYMKIFFGNPLQYSGLGNPVDKKSLVGYSPWGHQVRHDLAKKNDNSPTFRFIKTSCFLHAFCRLSLTWVPKWLHGGVLLCNPQFGRSVVSDRDPMDCSMPGFPVHHQLPELAQTHVHQVGDAIQPSHPLLSPSPAFNIS